MRLCKIDPFSTGPNFDCYSLLTKIRYWLKKLTFKGYRRRLAAMRSSLTSLKVSSAVLENSCDQLMRENALRLPLWKQADLREALAVGPQTRVETGHGEIQMLYWSDVIKVLHCAADKHYTNLGPEERKAVEKFKQETDQELNHHEESSPIIPVKIRKLTTGRGIMTEAYESLRMRTQQSEGEERGTRDEVQADKEQKKQSLDSDEVLLKALRVVGKSPDPKGFKYDSRNRGFTPYGFDGQEL